MLDPAEPVYRKELQNGNVLRTVATPEELEQVSQFNGSIHEPGVSGMTYKLFSSHPAVTGRDLAFIQNDQGQVIASLCLIPWSLDYGGVELPAAELGIVGTHPDYRRQGLNRLLMDYFWQRYRERGCLLSIIQGIPYFYRQFGYEYAHIPLEGGWRIAPDQIPSSPDTGFHFRLANSNDMPVLQSLYERVLAGLDLGARRSPQIWQYLLKASGQPEAMQHDTWLVENAAGQVKGYFRVPHFHFHPNLLCVDEVSPLSFEANLAALHHLKKLAKERSKDAIRFNLPPENGLLQLVRSFDAASLGVYSLQVNIPEPCAFLQRIAPLFEARLADTMFAGLSRSLDLDLYTQTLRMDFSDGKLQQVSASQKCEQPILSIPPRQFIPLVLGGRSLEQIAETFPDAQAHTPWQLLVDVLFPKTRSFVHTIY